MFYKKLFVCVLLFLISITVVCKKGKVDQNSVNKLKVVCTIGMITDVARNIGGDKIEVHGLLGPGVDPHLYKASAGDVKSLSEADIIFYNGLRLEAKMIEVFEKMGQDKMTVQVTKNIPDSLLIAHPVYENAYDPNVWFDVSLWKYVAVEIAHALSEKDPENDSIYSKNKSLYLKKLDSLDIWAGQRIETLPPESRILITAHDAFGYFGKSFGFEVVGLQGFSTEAEAGVKDVKELADLIVKKKIRSIFIESSVSERNIIAVQEAVKSQNWEVKIGGELFSDAMGSAGTEEGTYLGMVKHNINTIVEALNGEVLSE